MMHRIVLIMSFFMVDLPLFQSGADHLFHLKSENDCVRRILTKDTSLGDKRNHDCVEVSLSTSIDRYVSALSDLDFTDCPKAFTVAFQKHIKAWDEMTQVTDKYPDLRGEMHVIFDQIELSKDSTLFKNLLSEVWSTWEMVEDKSGVF